MNFSRFVGLGNDEVVCIILNQSKNIHLPLKIIFNNYSMVFYILQTLLTFGI